MDQAGTTHALTTLSPILPDRMRELTNRLRVVRYTPGLSRPLLQLAVIHYARWTVINWLPPSEGNGGWRGLRWKYLLFEGTYDGSQADYLRAFADILPARLTALWGACFGFEFATRQGAGSSGLPASGFQEFVELNALNVVDRYAAYPRATAIDVRQAILLHELLREASHDLGDPELEGRLASQATTTALGPLIPRLPLMERVRAVYDPWRRAVRGRYGVNPLTVITPLAEDLRATLLDACEPPGLLQSLSDTQTHFARLVIVPRHMVDLGQPGADVLETPYLLFSCDAWGTAYDQIEAIRTKLGDTADLIWGRCSGYPSDRNREAFHAWVDSHTLPTRYYVSGYPPRPVTEIKQLLRERDRVMATYTEELHPGLARLLAEVDYDHG
ncbi:MAG TPA: hypothetical protein VEF89_20500 [Solirubrobacteraceae bacterium]|nr:hypothetical protein [Solirubrobacteraceae bacterium]